MEEIRYNSSKKALLVIDIQEDYTGATAKTPYKESVQLIETVNKLIAEASMKNITIVYIKQEFDSPEGIEFSIKYCGGTAIKGKLGTEIDSRINILSNHCFSKPVPDAFANPEFETFLQMQKINELYLVGLDAAYCVYETAKGALKRGYKVFIIRDGIALRTEIEWDNLLKKYENEGITLIRSNDF